MDATAARFAAVGIFAAASLTDFLDGYLARKMKLVTNFGIFMDPIADKLLVAGALVAMVGLGLVPSWVVIIIISREFVISGLRVVAADNGVAIAAHWSGKVKTAVQMVMIIYVLIFINNHLFEHSAFAIVVNILIYLSAALALYSAVDYLCKNGHVLKEKK